MMKLERLSIQDDSLILPLFFRINTLIKRLDNLLQVFPIETGEKWFRINHLLFINDTKLYAKKEETLEAMISLTNDLLEDIGQKLMKANPDSWNEYTKYMRNTKFTST